MKRYLGVWRNEPSTFGIGVADQATEFLSRPHGRTSPLYPASATGSPFKLPSDGALLLLVPKSATRLLAILMNDLGSDTSARVYLSHGHAAAVVNCSDIAEARLCIDAATDELAAYEIWPHRAERVQLTEIIAVEPISAASMQIPILDSTGVGADGGQQVSQFNANLALLQQISSRYAPEMQPLVEWLHQSVDCIVEEMRELRAHAPDADGIRKAVTDESVIVELNAELTLLCSQLGSGRLPLPWHGFPVGEYSLFGIGSMVRASWSIYSHLNRTFATFDHIGAVQRRYRALPAFDAFAPSARLDYSAWASSAIGIGNITDGRQEGARYHIPRFSSRWGFHESLHSLSMSWQCLYASASREWNLLTITHEFMHAHVRDLVSEFIDPSHTPPDAILARYNIRSSGDNALESMQVAYVEALVGLYGSALLVPKAADPLVNADRVSVPERLDGQALQTVVRSQSGLFQEIIVHVLDFLYVYDGRDSDYVNSIWSSWSLVPSVIEHVDHYVFRTLCALAVESPAGTSKQIFDDAAGRLRTQLESLRDRDRIKPVIHRAIELLTEPVPRRQLFVMFPAGRYVVELARHFFVDRSLNAALVRDDLTTVRNGRRTYATDVGDYRGETIASPIGFLLDRFADYEDEAGSEEAEFASMWQMLQLT